MKPVPRHYDSGIDGEVYLLHSVDEKKKNAVKRKKELKEQGWKTKIIPVTGGHALYKFKRGPTP